MIVPTIVSDARKHVFEVEVYLGGLDPNSVKAELYANAVNGGEPERLEMKCGQQLDEANAFIFTAQVPVIRLATDYTARVIPQYKGVSVPLEANHILWQR